MSEMKTIVCYGDSNTYGQNPEFSVDATKLFRHPAEVRWTGILGECFKGKARVIEEGLSGRTTVWDNPVEPHRNGIKTLPACLMSHAPIDLLVIMLGTNDMRGQYTPIPFNLYNAMNAFLAEAVNPVWQIAGGNMKILLVSPPYLKKSEGKSPWPGLFPDEYVELTHQMASIYKSLADKYHIDFLDAAEYAEASDIDFAHMTPENHAKLAEALKIKIESILDF